MSCCVSSVCIPDWVSISTCKTACPFGSFIDLLMICCLRFLASVLRILLISCAAAVSSRLEARVNRHLRCLSRRAGASRLRLYISFIHETRRASTSSLCSARGFSMCIRLVALSRFRTSGTLPSCHLRIHLRTDRFRSHWPTVGLNSIDPSL